MTDGSKIAAAILAAEVSRRHQATSPDDQDPQSVRVGLISSYRYFLSAVGTDEPTEAAAKTTATRGRY